MIENLDTPFSDEESLGVLNGFVRKWFEKNFNELTPPQKFAFKLISEGKNALITAPTGSGKTLSAFLSIVSKLFDLSLSGKLEEKVYCIYISPLRALNNDVYRNLSKPLDEIYEMIKEEKKGDIIKGNIRKVSIAVRTGDTPQNERHKMLVHPPNILITTPESISIILNSEKFMENLRGLNYVIIDELHELANNKRGVHLSLSLERLADLTGKDFQRIGMGATLYPMEEAAKFLVGYDKNGELRQCSIVDASWSKRIEAKVISPVKDMIYTQDSKIENAIYSEIDKIIRSSRTTLVFTNTRSGTERVIFNLKKRFKYADEDIAAHHSSLSREHRLEVEEMLKLGSLKCAVTSTSLELGVDIGYIDNVVQLGSPKSITRAIQRIGRAGHSFKSIAKGEMIVTNRDDLIECSIMLDSALKRKLDSFSVPKQPLDVLAQHIVGMSLNRKWGIEEALAVVRRAYAYHDLSKPQFISLLDYLAGHYVGLESRRVYGKIWYDEKEGMFGRRGKYAKIIYMLNVGTIPDDVSVGVFTAGKKWVGNIEEEFMTRLKPGDIFTLGGKLYKFEYSRGMRCYVSPADTSVPTIPPWYSERLPLSFELADAIGSFRKEIAEAIESSSGESAKKSKAKQTAKRNALPEKVDKILSELPIDYNSKIAIYNYFFEQYAYTSHIPNDRELLIEETFDPYNDKRYIIFHSLYGRRTNDALSRLFAIQLSDMLDEEIGLTISDNGFVFTISKDSHISEREIGAAIRALYSKSIIELLKSNIRRTELMKRKFRQVASRGFMILRNYKGWKIPIGKQQVNSQMLLAASEEIDPNFPIISETYREILYDVMDISRAEEVLKRIREGTLKYSFIRTSSPSPFAHILLTFGEADVLSLKGKQEYLQYLHKMVLKKIGAEKGAPKHAAAPKRHKAAGKPIKGV
ncbi:MAG: ATP-dependent helicase [Candidatus Micrarchaeia archaeon]